MPYSCQLQFGWSGSIGCPCGGVITMRAIGREMSHCSSDISGQRIRRSPSGSLSGGRGSPRGSDQMKSAGLALSIGLSLLMADVSQSAEIKAFVTGAALRSYDAIGPQF